MGNIRKYKTVKLFYKGELYREKTHDGRRRAVLSFMEEQTKEIPVEKESLYYFEVESIGIKKLGRLVVAIDESGATNLFDGALEASQITGVPLSTVYSLLKNKDVVRCKNSKKIEFEWAD
jgi:hypothetical protein